MLSVAETIKFTVCCSTEKGSTSVADYNWECDPEAAHAVLAGLNRVITLLYHEVCVEWSPSWVCNVCSVQQFDDVWCGLVTLYLT